MSSAKVSALRMLSRRNYFSQELREKLLQKGFPEKEVAETLRSLANYLDDDQQLKRFVEAKQRRGYGPLAIRWKLRGKCTADVKISLEEQIEAIRAFLEKRYPNREKEDAKRIFAALQRRGFSIEAITKSLAINFTDNL